MPFCSNCGNEIDVNAKFCVNCGQANTKQSQQQEQRKVVYDGDVHKCPHCNETLNSFTGVCPSCGEEIRDSKSSSAVRDFSLKLETIENSRPVQNMSFKKVLANQRQVSETDQRKINLIRSFAIPNNKEDLFEFLILAGSNIRVERYDELSESQQETSDAWKSKFEQAYRKAKIVFDGDTEFRKIEALYQEKMREQKQAKQKSVMSWVLLFGGLLLLNVVLWGGVFLSDHIKIKNETERLEAIVAEVYEYIEEEQFVLARTKASTLVFSGSSTQDGDQEAAKWDLTRQQMLDIIDKAEYGANYVPSPREIRIGSSHDDLIDKYYSEVETTLKNRGFTNIKTEVVEDFSTGWWNSEGSVDKVSVGGDTVFSEDTMYSSDVEIIIYYHAKQ